MKNVKLKNRSKLARLAGFFFIFNFSFLISAISTSAENFGDVAVEADALYTGSTVHGYAEMRVVLENRSPDRTRVVTLTCPNNAFSGYGNQISRLSRTISLPPESHKIISLLQPPLPIRGDGLIRVEIDGRHAGEIRQPNNNGHAAGYYGGHGSTPPPVVLVSRSLDFDDVNGLMNSNTLFKATGGSVLNPASQAVGPPDAFGSGLKNLSAAWMPDTRQRRIPQWLEVDYARPQTVSKVVIRSVQFGLVSMPPPKSGGVTLMGVSGTNLLKLPLSAMKNDPTIHDGGFYNEITFPQTTEVVKTIRIEFGDRPPNMIVIDAVQIVGSSGSQWATNARASSENSTPVFSSSRPPGFDNIQNLRAESPVSDWSENWLAYTPFDAIVLDAADMSAMPPAVFNAVSEYLFAGGNVILFGQTDLPAAWHFWKKQTASGDAQYEIGWGHCLTLAAENPAALDDSTAQQLRELTRGAARYWQSLPKDGNAANSLFPVVDSLKIPTRGIVVIMLAFIIVIGPVNIIFLNRRKRRTWMLWTIPTISIATTLLVFIYSLLREGITPNTRIAGLTLLDQTTHRAATLGAAAFYCPLTPGGGLQFDYETEATPLVSLNSGSGTSREVDWTQAQHFSRGWVSARVPAHFHLRKSETRRERVQVENQNGKLQIVNGLGAPIKSLWFADAKGQIYQAKNVAAGQKAELTNLSGAQISEQLGAAGLNRDFGFTLQNLNRLDSDAAKYLLPNTYLAELDGNPFIENALGAAASPKRTRISGLVFGIMDSTTDEHR